MLITTEGTVVSQREYGDNDRIITILSPDCGLMDVTVKGAKKLTSKNGAAAQLFSASKYCLDERKGRYYLNSSETLSIFYDIRLNVEKLSLASYFADVIRYGVTQGQTAKDVYRLYMNTLHFLSNGRRSNDFLKFVFEMRMVSEMGLLPGLLGCADCYRYEGVRLYFDIRQGLIFCREHLKKRMLAPCEDIIEITAGQLEALRFVCLSEMERLFNFRISDDALNILCYISESFLTRHFDHSFKTLDFYNEMTGTAPSRGINFYEDK